MLPDLIDLGFGCSFRMRVNRADQHASVRSAPIGRLPNCDREDWRDHRATNARRPADGAAGVSALPPPLIWSTTEGLALYARRETIPRRITTHQRGH